MASWLLWVHGDATCIIKAESAIAVMRPAHIKRTMRWVPELSWISGFGKFIAQWVVSNFRFLANHGWQTFCAAQNVAKFNIWITVKVANNRSWLSCFQRRCAWSYWQLASCFLYVAQTEVPLVSASITWYHQSDFVITLPLWLPNVWKLWKVCAFRDKILAV